MPRTEKSACVYRALQARVSRQVMMNLEQGDSDDDPEQAERISLADLKYKGKKKANIPINRTGSALRSKDKMQIEIPKTAFSHILWPILSCRLTVVIFDVLSLNIHCVS